MAQERPISQLAREYERLSQLFVVQPAQTRHFLDQQAAALVAALDRGGGPIHCRLPERIILEGGQSIDLPRHRRPTIHIPARGNRHERLIRSLDSLERSLNPALSTCGELLCFALARHILYRVLPDGREVHYLPEAGEDIPSIPVTGAPVEAMALSPIGSSHVQYAEAARRFHLPQWVAFGEGDRLLVNSLEEAEASIVALQDAVRLLEDAVTVCPSLATDGIYQRKHAGLIGQLVNQGRALARVYTRRIVARLHERAAAGTLNRGLHLSLPYFDDEDMTMRLYQVEVIPDGRVMFVPAFVVRAMHMSEMQVRRDAHFSPSTRKHLLTQLTSVENAFNGHAHPEGPALEPLERGL
jgi:hypothetical protein